MLSRPLPCQVRLHGRSEKKSNKSCVFWCWRGDGTGNLLGSPFRLVSCAPFLVSFSILLYRSIFVSLISTQINSLMALSLKKFFVPLLKEQLFNSMYNLMLDNLKKFVKDASLDYLIYILVNKSWNMLLDDYTSLRRNQSLLRLTGTVIHGEGFMKFRILFTQCFSGL